MPHEKNVNRNENKVANIPPSSEDESNPDLGLATMTIALAKYNFAQASDAPWASLGSAEQREVVRAAALQLIAAGVPQLQEQLVQFMQLTTETGLALSAIYTSLAGELTYTCAICHALPEEEHRSECTVTKTREALRSALRTLQSGEKTPTDDTSLSARILALEDENTHLRQSIMLCSGSCGYWLGSQGETLE